MLEQKNTTVFPKTNQEKLIEFEGAIYELEDVLRRLDELQCREVVAKEAALAEQIARDKERAAYNYVAMSLGWE